MQTINYPWRFLAGGLAGILLAGCAGDPMKAIVDFATTPIVPVDQSRSAQPTSKSRELCDDMAFSSSRDVDYAYARATQTFGFRTVEERKRHAATHSMGMIDDGFRHRAQPGTMYSMQDYNQVAVNGARYSSWTSMEIWRNERKGTDVKLRFCAFNTDGSESTRLALRSAYQSAFQ